MCLLCFSSLCRNNQAGEVEPSPPQLRDRCPRCDSGRHAAGRLSRRDAENPITEVGVSEHLPFLLSERLCRSQSRCRDQRVPSLLISRHWVK